MVIEGYQKNLGEALRRLKIADHMTYVTLPLVNEHRLMLKIFDEIYLSVINLVNAVLNYEAMYKRVRLDRDSRANLVSFVKLSKRYYELSNSQIKDILEIIELNKKHKESAMEFVRQEKVVIMSDSLRTQVLDIGRIKEYLLLNKELMARVRERLA